MSRLKGRLPESREARLVLGALVALLVVGAVLRLLFVASWRPALMGWPDAASYIDHSHSKLFANNLRPAGYPLVLKGLRAVMPSLLLVVVVQHLLGLASAVLLYLSVARTGVPRALGLIPAGVIALGGDVIFLEHSPISETLFIFLIALSLYAGVRAHEGGLRWAAICGLALALAATVRVVALPVLPLVILWLALGARLPLRRRLLPAAAAAGAALALLGGYYVAEYSAEGRTGLSRNGVWNVYGRVAPFADCKNFKPPRGTEALCENTPRPTRPYTYQYTFNYYYSPAIRIYDNPHVATSDQTAQVAAFTWTVILNQPLSYLEEVGAGMLRYVAPDSFRGYGGGPGYHDLVHDVLFNRTFRGQGLGVARKRGYEDAGSYSATPTLIRGLRAWASVTRIQGPVFVLLALLSLAAPFVTRGRVRSAAILFLLVAWTLMLIPVATVEFSARTAVPGFGALAAAAALGGYGAFGVLRRRSRSRAGDGRVAPAG